MQEWFVYGPGIPRYLALWLPLAPLLVIGLWAGGVRGVALGVAALSTLPTFALHTPPPVPHVVRWGGLLAVLTALVWWLARAMGDAGDAPGPPAAVRWPVVVALAGLALALRVPLAWLDPGVGDFARASELAARQLLGGANPYLLENPHTTAGLYQYPAGSLLAHVPFAAAIPVRWLGEQWLGGRAVLWTTDAAAIGVMAVAGARLGRPRAGLMAAFAYAVHPTLVRESGLVVANDLLLALAVLATALLLARGRPWLAAVALGLAIAVKPPAVAVLPVLALAGGLRPALAAVAVPLAVQLPFLLWPSPGLQGLAAIAEPAARLDAYDQLRFSAWWPLYARLGTTAPLLRAVTIAGVVAALGAACWAGLRLRGRATPATAAAAVALPLVVSFALASGWRTTFQDWALPALLWTVAWRGPPAERSAACALRRAERSAACALRRAERSAACALRRAERSAACALR